MYAIYSNVEDPDGFYGIQTHDVKNALRRRLQHEKQSERAFGLNAAAFETGTVPNATQSSALSLMSNLHEMGFDHLSSAIQTSTRSSQQQGDDAEALLLELAWRTGDWDLPLSSAVAQSSHGGFYNCLRAVHKQRDQNAAKVLVDTAIRSEIGRLSDLGLERMAQIKDSSANLVCLREISLWLSEDTQRALTEGDQQHKALSRLGSLSQTMEWAASCLKSGDELT
jgi:ataxia telangiectasia mutated family protein